MARTLGTVLNPRKILLLLFVERNIMLLTMTARSPLHEAIGSRVRRLRTGYGWTVKGLAEELATRQADWAQAGVKSVKRIGDCNAPGIIAAAVFSGHRYAREFGEVIDPDIPPFKREKIAVE